MPLITFATKDDGGVGAVRYLTDDDVNEIKTVVNANALPREQTTGSTATVSVNADNVDLVTITAQAAGLTIANPTGTPVQGQTILYRIKDNGTARSLTWGSNFRAMGVSALPSTTIISKLMYITAIWNATDTKYDVWVTNQP